MPPPPFVTCFSTASNDGLRASRFGPTVPGRARVGERVAARAARGAEEDLLAGGWVIPARAGSSSSRRSVDVVVSAGPGSAIGGAVVVGSARPIPRAPARRPRRPRRGAERRSAGRRRSTPQIARKMSSRFPGNAGTRPRDDERHDEREDDERRARRRGAPARTRSAPAARGTLPRCSATRSRYCSSGAIVRPRSRSCVQ